ncbi:MAG TPA: tetratricopeptide repeat protein [Alphaproteobacteria bacterium]|nr:tetratricopeptide repeat protein [Alphaproteobacteria bacterium]
MYKQLLSATAIALAFSLQGCGSLSPPHEDNAFTAARPPAKSAFEERLGLADAALAAGDSASAIRMYRDLAREYPISLEPRLKLGAALLAANAPQEAARAYDGANAINPTYEGLCGIGRVYLALRQPAYALHAFDRAAKIRPDDVQARNGQGVALDQLGRHAEAQKIYLTILEKEPSNIKVRSNYALSLAYAGKYDQAADILNSLAQVPDSDDRIRQNLALVYGLAGNSGQAAHFGRMDLDEDAVSSNLKYYGAMRNLDAPAEKSGAMTRPTAQPTPNQIGPFDAAQSKLAPQTVASARQSAPEPLASAANANGKSDARIKARNIDPHKAHAAEKPVLGLAGMKPVVVARVDPAESSSPAEAKAPSDEELAEILAPEKPQKMEVKETKPAPKAAAKAKHTSLADLPMTRAEAAAQAIAGNSDDLVPTAQEQEVKTASASAAHVMKSAKQPVPVAVASVQPDQEASAAAAKSQTAMGSRQPAVPPAGTGVTASVKPRPAVPAVGPKPSADLKTHRAVSASAVMIESNPIDAGARPPAVL